MRNGREKGISRLKSQQKSKRATQVSCSEILVIYYNLQQRYSEVKTSSAMNDLEKLYIFFQIGYFL